jgi:predicted permease
MSFVRRIRKLRGLNEEIAEELRFHLEERVRLLIADGLTADQARREARKAFGSPLAARDYTRDAWLFRWADDLWRDLCFAARGLRRSPGFTAVAVLTLALGIGCSAAMYAALSQLVFVKQPYPDLSSLVVVEEVDANDPQLTSGIAGDAFAAIQEGSDSFASIAGYNGDGFLLPSNDSVRVLEGALVTSNVFGVLGVAPILGRTLTADSSNGETVISELAWKRYFGGRPDIIGGEIELNGNPHVVIGVMPEGFWPDRDLWVPLGRTVAEAGHVRTWARLRAPRTTAESELGVLSQRLLNDNGIFDRRLGLRDPFAISTGRLGVVAASAVAPVALLFLIVCVNVVHLQLGRDRHRNKEIALRAALGAGQARLVRQLLTESLLLATVGGAAAIGVAWWGVRMLQAYLPGDMVAAVSELRIDAGSLFFLALLSLAATAAIGIIPGLRASRPYLLGALRAGGGGHTGAKRRRGLLVTSELALSMMLLAGTGLAGVLLRASTGVEMGFDYRNLWAARLSLRGPLAEVDARREWAENALRTMRSTPGVVAAAVATELPLRGGARRSFESSSGPGGQLEFRAVSSEYFSVMNMPLRSGRAFNDSDAAQAAPVVIVSEELARRLFSDSAIGARFRFDPDPREWMVVGVVGDTRQTADARPAPPVAYVPFAQYPRAPLSLVIRTEVASGIIGSRVLEVLGAPSDELLVQSIFDFAEGMNDSHRVRRFLPILMAIFAAIGLVLASVGLYGTALRSVAARTREFGVRQALGARKGDVLGLVMRESCRGGLAGVALGGAGALAAARLVLAGLNPDERAAYGVDLASITELALSATAAAALLLIVVAVAAYLPARLAAKIEPATALRHD